MTNGPAPLRFGAHLLAIIGAALLASTCFALVWGAGLTVATGARLPGLTWLLTLVLLCWLAVFIVVLPGAGLVFSLLWPVTRRGTRAARAICLLAAATAGLILAPLASPHLHGAGTLANGMFVLTGLVVAAFYLIIAERLGRARATDRPRPRA